MSAAAKWIRDIPDLRQRTISRLMDKVICQDDDECWRWGAATDKDGYGTFQFSGILGDGVREKRRAHRVSYEIFHGQIPDDLLVCHTCDNTACINPAHLFLGPTEKNVEDRVAKSRSASGQNHGTKTKPDSFVRAAKTRRRLIEFRGRKQSLHDISVETGVPLVALKSRISRGWDIERAISTPPKNCGRNVVWPSHTSVSVVIACGVRT